MAPDASETGRIIRQRREAAGLSQRELAERIGSHQPAIARLEAGTAGAVNMRTLDRIAEALGYRVEWDMVTADPTLQRPVTGTLEGAPAPQNTDGPGDVAAPPGPATT